MAKITSKYQVKVPKAIAEQYGLHPGDEIEWMPAGDAIRVVPSGHLPTRPDNDVKLRLRLFDEATRRIQQKPTSQERQQDRGWTREDLYDRGRSC
jgi:AbrB family looped-hinge helix DNA binding protein